MDKIKCLRQGIRDLEILEYNNYKVSFNNSKVIVENHATDLVFEFYDLIELHEFVEGLDKPCDDFYVWRINNE